MRVDLRLARISSPVNSLDWRCEFPSQYARSDDSVDPYSVADDWSRSKYSWPTPTSHGPPNTPVAHGLPSDSRDIQREMNSDGKSPRSSSMSADQFVEDCAVASWPSDVDWIGDGSAAGTSLPLRSARYAAPRPMSGNTTGIASRRLLTLRGLRTKNGHHRFLNLGVQRTDVDHSACGQRAWASGSRVDELTGDVVRPLGM